MAGFVCDVDSVDFFGRENGIVHPFVYAVFEHGVVGHRDEVCVGILGQDIPVEEKDFELVDLLSH